MTRRTVLVFCLWGVGCFSSFVYAAPTTRFLSSQKHAASFHKTHRYRSNRCWRWARDIRRSIRVQKYLLLRLKRFKCDIKLWQTCRRKRFSTRLCQKRSIRLRWGRCFRMHRRLFVVTARIVKWSLDARRARCRWSTKIPASFEHVIFEPFPKIRK